jgi:hypothetical protein
MLYIGTDPITGGYYHHGALDDLRIYGRALSIDEIEQLYNSTN